MWERFGFYTIAGMLSLYLIDREKGFGWDEAEATTLLANYLMFVYASPLVGGWIADRWLGYRNSVLLGGVIFMVGYLLLYFPDLWMLYAALGFLVIGNGFFKPNVSAMVGHLYPENSPLKDRAYNLFYMGINVGALMAPLVGEFLQGRVGFRPAFLVAALGMVFSVVILWTFRRYVREGKPHEDVTATAGPETDTAAIAADAPPPGEKSRSAMENVPEAMRIAALVVIFLIVIVFWMVFHQNTTTLTYWAKQNTDWQFSGIISNAINPFWVVTLTFPLVWFWKWLDKRGLEPSTPTKMALGMVMTSLAFLVLYFVARDAESGLSWDNRYDFRVSPLWLVGAYAVLTMGELMLSPMGLSLVSKVAPPRLRGVMMGGWFVATAIGNKLTQIGVLWKYWWHSSFWLLLSGLAVTMAVVLLVLLRPLKRAMPGV
jgi:POT family proton-dependent oligopeptide transporter